MLTTALKQRIVGAIFILSLGVILIPVILDKPQEGLEQETLVHTIPDAPALPDVSEVSKIHYVFDEENQLNQEIQANEENQPAPIPALAVNEIPAEVASTRPAAPSPAAMEPAQPPETAPPFPPPAVPPQPSQGHIKASATLAQAAQAQWTIQLGAFSSEKNAKALVQKLSQGGFSPYLKAMAQDSLVRVYVSPGIPREQAVDLAAKLDAEYGLKGIVVRYFQ